MSSMQDRLRVHPEIRFAPRQDVFDLNAVAESLMREPNAGQHGHRQEALFRDGSTTLALYCFEPGSFLADHIVDGPVIIHVLSGRVTVTTEEETYELGAGMLIRLAAGVRHDVAALESSQMLLTIFVAGPRSHTFDVTGRDTPP